MLNPQTPARSHGRLDKQNRLLLVVNGLFITANALSGTFFGVYIWKASQNFSLLAWFTLLGHICMALTFWLAGRAVKMGRKKLVLGLGIGGSAVFYALVLLLGTRGIDYIWLLGAIQGTASGLFWLAYNVIYFEVTDPDNRDRFNGLAGVTGAVAGMAAPWFSGFMISRMTAESGYRTIFILSLGIFVAGVLAALLLRNRQTEGKYDWRLPWRIWSVPRTSWRPVLAALIIQGVRESVFGMMIGLLVYIQTGSELRLGNYTLITSAVAFVGFYAVGRWLKPAWRIWGMLAGAVVMTLVIVLFFFGITYSTMIVFGVATSLMYPLYGIPMTSAVFDLIGGSEESARQRVEYVVVRELALNAGRIAGMAAFLVTVHYSRAPLVLNILMLIVGSAPLFSWLFMRGTLRMQARQSRQSRQERRARRMRKEPVG
ncbi:MFS transporter [Cohnella lubricantis]|uniref:MFS transporter n=1 Tax=Cohnella lubricantis TaxID=2163172 RepID=A0A841TAA0_9BACL|nr:MFS transporter [Cohnella lubricantis]MBB6676328.1 MFS transporter [Cohnella lubricantis]MBP2120303.1 YQGE family putative transporter [Cohnella lubricantis]